MSADYGCRRQRTVGRKGGKPRAGRVETIFPEAGAAQGGPLSPPSPTSPSRAAPHPDPEPAGLNSSMATRASSVQCVRSVNTLRADGDGVSRLDYLRLKWSQRGGGGIVLGAWESHAHVLVMSQVWLCNVLSYVGSKGALHSSGIGLRKSLGRDTSNSTTRQAHSLRVCQ